MPWLQVVIDVPSRLQERSSLFWGSALGWPAGPAWPDHPELRSLEPAEGTAYVHLQVVDAEPRVHLDVEVDDLEEAQRAAVALGAVATGEQEHWRALRSPGGLPFCVVRRSEGRPPAPVTVPAGHRVRLVQVCIDSPVDVHDAEVAFWRALLGPRWFPSDAPEFAGKWHDGDGSPLQLLLQRLEEPTGPVRAHLDLGTDDLPAEVARHLALGAEDIGPGRGWHALRDPAGLPYCVTENSPEQVRVRDLGQPARP